MKKIWQYGLLVLFAFIAGCSSIEPVKKPLSTWSSDNFVLRKKVTHGCPADTISVVSWNLANFGKSKSPEEIATMAKIVMTMDPDIIAGQEVSLGYVGERAVKAMKDELTSSGTEYNYSISDRPKPYSSGGELYAYWWKSGRVGLIPDGTGLVSELENEVDREPYKATFMVDSKKVVMYQIHTIPTEKIPVNEVIEIARSHEFARLPKYAIFSGDFNLGSSETDPHLVPLGLTPNINTLTSLKAKVGPQGEHKNNHYDNIYTTKGFEVTKSGVIDFPAMYFAPITNISLKASRKLSDHLPVYACLRPL